jgi:WD40 repeat protein
MVIPMLQRIANLPLAALVLSLPWGFAASSVFAQEVGRLNWPTRIVDSHRAGQISPVVTGIAIRPQAAEAAVVGDDHIVHLVDLSDGRLLKTLPGHQDWIRTLAFSPDGQSLITAGSDRRILKWDLSTQRWSILATGDASIESIAFSPDGQRLAAVGFESQVRIFDVRTGRALATLDCPCADLRAVGFSPDGRRLAAGGRSGELLVWEAAGDRWKQISRAAVHQQRIQELEFASPDQILTVSEDRTVHLLSLIDPQQSGIVVTLPGKLYAMAVISPNLIACGGTDNRISLIDLQRKEVIGYLAGHRGTISSLAFAGQTLVSGSYDGETRVWQTQSATAVAFQPDGNRGAVPPRAVLELPVLERSASRSDADPPLLPIRSLR